MPKKKIGLWIIIAGVILLLIATSLISAFFVSTKYRMAGGIGEGGLIERRLGAGSLREDYASLQIPRAKAARVSAVAEVPQVRKLIKRAEVNLEVKSCEETARRIVDLVNNFSGIILDSEIQKYPNEARSGRTVLKVTPHNFDVILGKLKELGKVDLIRVTGEDVTEEYVDLEARLKNYQVVKERLLIILEDKAKTVKDILEVERELARLGEQIEMIQGRMKYLDRQVELSTITVSFYEPRAIAPEPLNIFKRLKETIRKALETFINVFNGLIVVIAAILPVIIWLAIIVAIVIIIKKLFFKK